MSFFTYQWVLRNNRWASSVIKVVPFGGTCFSHRVECRLPDLHGAEIHDVLPLDRRAQQAELDDREDVKAPLVQGLELRV